MLKLMGKKIFTILFSKFVFIYTYASHALEVEAARALVGKCRYTGLLLAVKSMHIKNK